MQGGMGNPAMRGMGGFGGGNPQYGGNPAMRTGGNDVFNAPPPTMNPALRQTTGGNDTFMPRNPVLNAPQPYMPTNQGVGLLGAQGFGGGATGPFSPGALPPGQQGPQTYQDQPTTGNATMGGSVDTGQSGPTLGQSMGLSPGDPRYNLKEGDSYAGGIVMRNPNGGFTIGANNMSGPLAGTSYGQYINPTGGGGIGNINGHNLIFGNEYHGEGLNQDNGTMNPNSGFNVFLRQQAAAMNRNMPNDPRTQQINQYLAGLGGGGMNTPMNAPNPMGKIVPGGNPAMGRFFRGR